MKGVIYARYSSDNQREESIEGQLRECKEFAKRNDIDIVGEYIDRAKSATTDRRPDFQRMVADSAKHGFDVIIVWKLDRFARNRYDSAHYKAQLRKNGVRVISATEAISEGAEGVLLESVLEGMAEYYSKELAEKTLRGMTENALACKCNGQLPLGFKADENRNILIDEQYAPIVLEAFNMYADGATMKDIMRSFNARGIRNKKGRPISLNIIAAMLHNRKYIGEYSFKDIVIPNGIPTIVPEELFNRVQERMALNAKSPGRHTAEEEYLLTTKLFCGTCKRMMTGDSCRNRYGVKYQYYSCNGHKYHKDCNRMPVKKEYLENAVITKVRDKLLDDSAIEKLIKQVLADKDKLNTVLPVLQKQLREVEKGIDNIICAIQQGVNSPTATKRLNELESEKRNLELAIAKEEMTHSTLTEEKLRMWFERFRGLDLSKIENRRRLIDSFVNAIYLFDDKVVITLNYENGTAIIPYEEIESSDLGPLVNCKGEPNRPLDFYAKRSFLLKENNKFWDCTITTLLRCMGV